MHPVQKVSLEPWHVNTHITSVNKAARIFFEIISATVTVSARRCSETNKLLITSERGGYATRGLIQQSVMPARHEDTHAKIKKSSVNYFSPFHWKNWDGHLIFFTNSCTTSEPLLLLLEKLQRMLFRWRTKKLNLHRGFRKGKQLAFSIKAIYSRNNIYINVVLCLFNKLAA